MVEIRNVKTMVTEFGFYVREERKEDRGDERIEKIEERIEVMRG